MEPTPKSDATSPKTDGPVARLRLEVYDALAKAKGLDNVSAQAAYHGIGRQHMTALKAGRKSAGLGLALKMAADLDTTVEALFRRVAA